MIVQRRLTPLSVRLWNNPRFRAVLGFLCLLVPAFTDFMHRG
jgi:hypothetical protein